MSHQQLIVHYWRPIPTVPARYTSVVAMDQTLLEALFTNVWFVVTGHPGFTTACWPVKAARSLSVAVFSRTDHEQS